MVMDHRICLDPFKLFGIEILQIGGFQVYQLDAALAEIGSDDALHHSLIAGIQTGGFPLGLSLSGCVLVTQNDVVEVVFFLQMPCYHNVSSCLCIHLNM